MKVEIINGNEVRHNLLAGAKLVADSVGATMGPGGQLAISPGTRVYPKITKDGVSVAKALQSNDPHINYGVMMVIQACARQVIEAGDGTTLTAVLAHKMLESAISMVASGHNIRTVIWEMQEEGKRIAEIIRSRAIKVQSVDDLIRIAQISSNGDKVLGNLIGQAIWRIGQDGFIIYERAITEDHKVSFDEGMKVETGIKYPHFFNKENEGLLLGEMDMPFIFVSEHSFSFGEELKPLMKVVEDYNKLHNTQRWVILICPDIRDYALSALLDNITRKKVKAAWIRPSKSLSQWEMEYHLADFAAITGAKNFTKSMGQNIKNISLEDLGTARMVRSNPFVTQIVGRNDNSERIEERKNYLKNYIEGSNVKGLELEHAQKSYARLNGGMATLYVGGQTDTEQNEILDRVDDAVRACQSALQEGICPGGGVEFLNVKREVYKNTRPDQPGHQIIYDSLRAATERILKNYGRPDADLIIQQIEKYGGSYGMDTGYCAEETMAEKDVVDPAKVLSQAILNSVSVVSNMMQAYVSIANTED